MPPKSQNVEVARLEIAYEWMSIHKLIFFLMSRACNLHGEPMTEARATALFHHQVEHGGMRKEAASGAHAEGARRPQSQ